MHWESNRVERVDMRSARFFAVLTLWCASKAALSAQYVHENEVYDKNDVLGQDPVDVFNKKFNEHRNDKPPIDLKTKINKEQPLDYSNEPSTKVYEKNPPSSYNNDDDTKNLYFFVKKDLISKAAKNDVVHSYTNNYHDIETRGTTVDPVTLSEESTDEDEDMDHTSNGYSLGGFKSATHAQIFYTLASQHDYDVVTDSYIDRTMESKEKDKRFQKIVDSYREMEENLKHFNENINGDYNLKAKEDKNSLEHFLNFNPINNAIPNHPSDTMIGINRMKLLDYIARAAHSSGRRPTQAPTIILYGNLPEKSSAMSIFMPEPPECPKSKIPESLIKAINEGKFPQYKQKVRPFHGYNEAKPKGPGVTDIHEDQMTASNQVRNFNLI